MYDVIIIGAGPAGISAGLYTKRSNLSVLILYYGESSLEKARIIDNYYGFEDGISGKELYESGINQAKHLGIEIKKEEVLHIDKEKEFTVTTTNNVYTSKTLILATGNKKLRPNIKGILEFENKGISYCAICDGFFYKNKNVVIIGNGKFALSEANVLKNIANNVKILSNGLNIEFKTEFEVVNKKIREIRGDSKVQQVEFEDGTTINIDGIFIALGEASGVDFAKKMGVMMSNDNIIVDNKMQTNIEGLYSCGNVNGGLLQVCKAVYEGAEAGLSAVDYIKKYKEE